jgi:hypothetical protein
MDPSASEASERQAKENTENAAYKRDLGPTVTRALVTDGLALAQKLELKSCGIVLISRNTRKECIDCSILLKILSLRKMGCSQ